MKQYECENVRQVRAKIRELTRVTPPVHTKEEKAEEAAFWRNVCHTVKKDAMRGVSNWDGVSDCPALDEHGEEIEVRVCVGYDVGAECYLVWMEEN